MNWICCVSKRKQLYHSRTPVTWTLKGNEKQFELAGIWVIGVNFSEVLIKGRDQVSEEFELSEFKLLG